MAKEIILYNLADSVSDEEYKEYTLQKKGPFFAQLPSIKSFTLLRVTGSKKGEIPYNYVGIADLTGPEEWAKDANSSEFGAFMKEWVTKVSDFQILFGEEIFQGGKESK